MDDVPTITQVNMKLEQRQLTKNCDSSHRYKLRSVDGLLGGILDDGEWFITTPNADVLYEPPVGNERRVVLRKDNMYGADDPLLWPQFHCFHATHLACIPLKPDDTHRQYYEHMFMFDFNGLGSSQLQTYRKEDNRLGKARVTSAVLGTSAQSIDYLKTRIIESPPERAILEPSGRRTYIDQQLKVMEVGMLYLHNVEAIVNELNRHLLEIKRAWINSIAWLDYMVIYRTKFNPEGAPAFIVDHRMGCFASNPATVASARSAGLPVWFIQAASLFVDQVILKTASVQKIDEALHSEHNFPSNILFCGRNGDILLYQSIQRASRILMWGDSPSTATLYPPSKPYDTQPAFEEDEDIMTVSTTAGSLSSSDLLVERVPRTTLHDTLGHPYILPKEKTALRWGSKKSAAKPQASNLDSNNPPDEKKDNSMVVFLDLTGRLAPNTIPAFAGANLTINRKSLEFSERHKNCKNFRPVGYGFPPPHIITGAAEERANIYVIAWLHLRDALIHTTENHIRQLTVLPSGDWRELLSLGLLGEDYWTKADPTRKRFLNALNHKKELQKFAQDAIDYTRQNAPSIDALPEFHPFTRGHSDLKPLTLECADETLYLLSVLNFRFDIIMLDMHFTLGYVPGTRDRPAEPESGTLEADRMSKRNDLYRNCWNNDFQGHRGLFWFRVLDPNGDWANPDWNSCYPYIAGLVAIMKDWPIAKPDGFSGRCEALQMLGEGFTEHYTLEDGERVEREVICLFCQAFFNVFGRPPVLHHKSKYIPTQNLDNSITQ